MHSTHRLVHKYRFLSLALAASSACSFNIEPDLREGESSTSSNTPAQVDTNLSSTSSEDDSSSSTSNKDGTSTNEAEPDYVWGKCGALAVDDTPVSNEQNSAAEMTVGRVVKGRIDDSSSTNHTHYWHTKLPAGSYHLIADLKRSDGILGYLALSATLIDENGETTDKLISERYFDGARARWVAFKTLDKDQDLVLKVTSDHQSTDYHLAWVANHDPVPVPYLSDCPPVHSMTILPGQNPEQFRLSPLAQGWEVAEQWFKVKLEAKDYTFRAELDDIGEKEASFANFRVARASHFAQSNTIETLIDYFDNKDKDNTEVLESTLANGDPGEFLLRVRATHRGLDVKFGYQEQ